MPSLFLVIEDSKYDIVVGNGNLSFLICPYFFLPSLSLVIGNFSGYSETSILSF